MADERAVEPGPLFRVKICGVTTPDDARLAADAGADGIGLNFIPGSPRCIGLATAVRIAAALPPHIMRVGVFAGASVREILETERAVGLVAVQLHGELGADDPPERCLELAPIPVIRAVRLGEDGLEAARGWIALASEMGRPPSMVIIDASVPRGTPAGRLGGSGMTVDWHALARERPLGVAAALAGGLTAENVEEAVRVTGLGAVDTASGVESSPGRKDPARVRAFVAAARRALQLGG